MHWHTAERTPVHVLICCNAAEQIKNWQFCNAPKRVNFTKMTQRQVTAKVNAKHLSWFRKIACCVPLPLCKATKLKLRNSLKILFEHVQAYGAHQHKCKYGRKSYIRSTTNTHLWCVCGGAELEGGAAAANAPQVIAIECKFNGEIRKNVPSGRRRKSLTTHKIY